MEAERASRISIGEKLKSVREKKNLTIDQVHKQTRIHSSVITALEEGTCDEMLTPTYVKSFLKKYSQYLGLDPKGLIKEYETFRPKGADRGVVNTAPKETVPESNAAPKLLYALLFAVIVFLVLSAGILLTKSAFRYVKAAKAQKQKIKTSKAMPAKAAPPKAIQSPTAKKGPFNLVLKVKQPVLIKVKKDGAILFSRVLPKNSTESFTANDRIEIYVAKAEAIELTLNGKPLGSPGKGIIKNLEITSKGIKR